MYANIKRASAFGLVALTVVGTLASAQASPRIPKGHGKTPIGAQYLGGVFNDGGGPIIIPTKNGGFVRRVVPPLEPVMPGQAGQLGY